MKILNIKQIIKKSNKNIKQNNILQKNKLRIMLNFNIIFKNNINFITFIKK